jgi:hypothetical protein
VAACAAFCGSSFLLALCMAHRKASAQPLHIQRCQAHNNGDRSADQLVLLITPAYFVRLNALQSSGFSDAELSVSSRDTCRQPLGHQRFSVRGQKGSFMLVSLSDNLLQGVNLVFGHKKGD